MKTIFPSLVAALAMNSPASAVIATGNLKWTGNAGYVVEAEFSFDSHRPFLHEFYGEDDDTNSGLINFSYSVFDPAGTLLGTGDDVINRCRDYWYMEFHFNTIAGSLVPGRQFEIGDDPGYWLSGRNGSFVLNYEGLVEDPDEPGFFYEDFRMLDRGSSFTSSATGVTALPPVQGHSTPEGGAGLVLTGGCLFGLVAARRFRARESAGDRNR